MPRACCVLGCKSNVRSLGGPVVPTFSFPNDEKIKKLWLQCIDREDLIPTYTSAVCIRHFQEKFIIRETSDTRQDCSQVVVRRLRTYAYPSVRLKRLRSQSLRKNHCCSEINTSIEEEEDCTVIESCCVSGCFSNLRAPLVTMFPFPDDESQKNFWLKCIGREDYVPTRFSAVCIHHFREEFIQREIKSTRSNGAVVVIPSEKPSLVPDAFPSLFIGRTPKSQFNEKTPPAQNRRSRFPGSQSKKLCVNEELVVKEENIIQEAWIDNVKEEIKIDEEWFSSDSEDNFSLSPMAIEKEYDDEVLIGF